METPTLAAAASPGPEQNQWLARFNESKHSIFADQLYALNPEIPDDFVKVGAVCMEDGLTPEKMFVKVFRDDQKTSGTPLAVLRIAEFTNKNLTAELKVPGFYKAMLCGRWRHSGMLKQERFQLEPSHFAQAMPQAAMPVQQHAAAAAAPSARMDELMVRIMEKQLLGPAAPTDALATAKQLMQFVKENTPPAPVRPIEELIAEAVKKAIPTEPGEGRFDWMGLAQMIFTKLPEVVAIFKPAAAAAPAAAADQGKSLTNPPAAAAAAPTQFDQMLAMLKMGIAGKDLPDAYASILATLIRSLPDVERDGLLAMPDGALAEILIAQDESLASSREWLQECESMMRAEFEPEEPSDEKGQGNATGSPTPAQ